MIINDVAKLAMFDSNICEIKGRTTMKIRKSRVAWAIIAVLIFSLVSPGQVVFSTNSNNTGPALAFDDTNDRYLMVYTDDAGSGENEILGQYLNSNGSAEGDAFAISNDSGPYTSAPDIVFDDDSDRFMLFGKMTADHIIRFMRLF